LGQGLKETCPATRTKVHPWCCSKGRRSRAWCL